MIVGVCFIYLSLFIVKGSRLPVWLRVTMLINCDLSNKISELVIVPIILYKFRTPACTTWIFSKKSKRQWWGNYCYKYKTPKKSKKYSQCCIDRSTGTTYTRVHIPDDRNICYKMIQTRHIICRYLFLLLLPSSLPIILVWRYFGRKTVFWMLHR